MIRNSSGLILLFLLQIARKARRTGSEILRNELRGRAGRFFTAGPAPSPINQVDPRWRLDDPKVTIVNHV